MPPKWLASISAKLLLAVAPFRSDFEDQYKNFHAFTIEPHPAGGVLVIATDGHTLGVVYDRTGRASGPMVVHLPPALLDACRPLQVPRLFVQGAVETPEAPAWMVPDKVFLAEICAFVCHGDEEREGVLFDVLATTGKSYGKDNYRLLPEVEPLHWRGIIPSAPLLPLAQPTYINPALLVKFTAAAALSDRRFPQPGLVLLGQEDPAQFADPLRPIVVRCREFADFWGVMHVMRPEKEQLRAVPEWLATAEPAVKAVQS